MTGSTSTSTSTSVGTGTPQDRNDNHPTAADPCPSRTLGADAPQARPLGDAAAPQVTSPEQAGQAFPEGPNVAPSPWEEEAARGRS